FAPNRYHADTSRKEYASSGPYANEIQLGGPKTPTVREGVVTASNGKLLYKFSTNAGADLQHAEVLFSYGPPGHWTGRSWRRVPAKRSGTD
ncbi:hypothetical protein, partial [Pseudomonas sp. GW456-L14]|uniref:hypothetical protein n=1 Tax=Pseudomonas sp. GW456-L14 TaxID=2070632 RepID=UPI001C47820F